MNIANMNSKCVKSQIAEVSEKFGIPENRIHPVRNYKTQTRCVMEMNILTLMTLRQILRYSEDFLKDKKERRVAKVKAWRMESAEMEICNEGTTYVEYSYFIV